MKLYYHPGSSRSRRVLALVAELKIELEKEVVDLAGGAQRSEPYLAVNPNGVVPALVDGDFALWESAAILQYLASLQPTSLYPEGARARADITRWLTWTVGHLEQATNVFLFENVIKGFFGLGAASEAELARGTELLRKHAGVLEAHLAGRQWLVGDGATIADFMVAGSLFWNEMGKMSLAPYPGVQGWLVRVLALPGWQATA
ncbi:MAG: glutathione S-transferase family protein [Myxococcota bacterium]